jgi:hypothetical protein
VAGSYVSGGSQRQAFRRDFLNTLKVVERERWAYVDSESDRFLDACRDLESTALVARMPRDLVLQYLVLARTAWLVSSNSLDTGPLDDDEGNSGGVISELATLVRDAAEDLARIAWSHLVHRVDLRGRVQRRQLAMDELKSEELRAAIESAEAYFNQDL